jgi:hypothetical protein
MPRFLDFLLGSVFGVGVGFVIAAFAVGCKSPYPPCSNNGTYRCSDNVVELCNNGSWNPQTYCDEVSYMGTYLDAQCVQEGINATCEEIE